MSIHAVIASAIGLSLGIGWATVYSLPLPVAFFIGFLALMIAVLSVRRQSQYHYTIRWVVIGLLCMSIGIVRTEYLESQYGQSVLQERIGQTVTIQGVVIREPEERSRNRHLHVASEETIVLVTVDKYTTVAYGDTIAASGVLKVPETFTTDLGRTFNYPGYLSAKGIEYTMAYAQVVVIDTGNTHPVVELLIAAKQQFITRLETLIREPYAALANGLLLGMKEGLGDELEQAFQRAGLTHIVVLSGYNVMLIVTFFTFLLAWILPAKPRLVVGLMAIGSFAVMVGLSATVVRASIMAALFLLAQTLGRHYDVLRSLLIAGIVMLLINPYLLLYDIGFQLSFMATLGLILALPYFTAPGQPETIGVSLKGYVLSTIATQIAVLPLLLYHIGEVSIVSVIVNVLVLPMVPVAMFLSSLTVLATFISPPLALIVSIFATASLAYIILIAQWFSSLSFATIVVPTISPLLVGAGYGVIGLLYYYFTKVRTTPTLRGWKIVEEQ